MTKSLNAVADRTDQLVRENLRLVRRIAHELASRLPSSVSIEDLMQAGSIGLLEAIRQFDPTRRVSFESYATIRVRGAILDEVRRQDWSPRSVHRKQRAIDYATQSVEAVVGRPARAWEVATELGLTLEAYCTMVRQIAERRVLWLDELSSWKDCDQRGADNDDDDPASDYERHCFGLALRFAIDTLTEQQRRVLVLSYGKGLNLRQIGSLLGLTDTRICQIRTRAIRSLRENLSAWHQASIGKSAKSECLREVLCR